MTAAQAASVYAGVLADARRSSARLVFSSAAIVTALLLDFARRIAELSDEDTPPTEARRREIEREIGRLLLLLALAINEQLTRTIEAGVAGLVDLHREAHVDLARAAGVPAPLPALGSVPGDVERRLTLIRGGLSRERSMLVHADEAQRSVSRMLDVAQREGIPTRAIVADISRALTRRTEPGQVAAKYGVGEADTSGLTSLRSDARRLGISEGAGAARTATSRVLTLSPIVIAAPWLLSPVHDPYDECDFLAESNLYGMGRGYYPVDHWPAAPHPYCQCFMGERVRVRQPDEWMNPKLPGPPVRVNVIEAIRLAGQDWSDRRQERLRSAVYGA